MKKKDFQIGDHVFWFVGPRHCTGTVIEIYHRELSNDVHRFSENTDRALLVYTEEGKKIIKLESDVMLEEQRNYG